jgi:hypothetical protein
VDAWLTDTRNLVGRAQRDPSIDDLADAIKSTS